MTEQLNQLLKEAYHRYKDDPNPPVPLKTIKEFLEFEGVPLEQEEGE